ncbi:Calcineurin-like phosphoesterase [Pseudidiomarina planktonica]|uniref:Calcineurin-like phosphoesterase n=1 Tax=Pseudidiomarina planktonica TaxID=1323738 RepID=A0A1Y6EQZ5_9GAMM|nr:metallophosphoesterase family protein [Pseudidiomarina planktonica]RUO65417.1 metallophosphoesterase [Pseudidiomarina planktonica]SMQ65094.1 Calcineurin-like phosphoesterase [Pseudidiomarina planktonica]
MPYSKLTLVACALSLALSTTASAAQTPSANTSIPDGQQRYQVTAFPDRIALLGTATPHNSQTVTWRTNAQVKGAKVQISNATPSPGMHLHASEHTAEYVELESPNGKAHHHRVTVNNLQPDTLYAYRVSGEGTWSDWYQFKTPTAKFTPYTALYLGDAQNAVYSHYSRTVREAIRTAPRARVMLYAGDLVNSRSGIHDNEWGEWFAATSWMASTLNQLPAAGNHEFSSDDDNPIRYLLPNWTAHYKVAGNGPEALSDTVYFSDYQGVRYIALDSTEALQHESKAKQQAEWLEQVLANNPNRWTVVFHHHPIQSVSKGRDNPILREYWQPVYEKYNVDLVLQGHDHTYGRMGGVTQTKSKQGPIYVVSVAGPKMYLVSDNAKGTMTRTAEDTQLFQTLDFTQEEIVYRSYTATGDLYDGFTLHKSNDGEKSFTDEAPATANRVCENPSPSREDRCWNGTDLIYAKPLEQ